MGWYVKSMTQAYKQAATDEVETYIQGVIAKIRQYKLQKAMKNCTDGIVFIRHNRSEYIVFKH